MHNWSAFVLQKVLTTSLLDNKFFNKFLVPLQLSNVICVTNFRLAIWPYAKLILSCWLVLPNFNGAAHVYRHYVRPFYMNPQMPQMPQIPRASQMWYVPRKNIFSKQDDVLTAAERYMEEHGTEVFERLITKVHIFQIFWWQCRYSFMLNLTEFDFSITLDDLKYI